VSAEAVPAAEGCGATYLRPPYALLPLVVDDKGKSADDDGCPVLDEAALAEVAEHLRVHGDRIGKARRAINGATLHMRGFVSRPKESS
jgi:hypothetical protein